MAAVRVLVAADTVGALSSRQAGEALATGWPRARVAVVPLGTAGGGFVQAAADLWGTRTVTTGLDGAVVTRADGREEVALRVEQGPPPGPGLPLAATSVPLGAALAALLAERRPRRVHVDLTGLAVHDGGAGLLAALGAEADVALDAGVAGLTGLSRLDLRPVRARLGGTELVGVVPADALTLPLLGLRGITSRGRDAGLDPADLLRTDADLEQLARLAGEDQPDAGLGSRPGAGACGGLGLAVLALGGRLASGPELGLAAAAPGEGRPGPDLVVTACSVFDFAARGGGVVAAAAAAAAAALAPCVVVAGEVLIGAREMRTMGVEAAYAVRETTADVPAGGDVGAAELAATAHRVGRSWSW
ncbi:glycerate kinase [Friedmanniella luteola]|uniref:glycerate kinase n=1 Tax=Friedmanniella luteola TaxID=546871 RepID=UPI000B848DE5|nr:glycerate kinase [Friedmanniella luteola]